MTRTGTVYRLVCSANGKFIVGSALSYKRRQDYYWSYLRRGKWNNPYVQSCYNKYGKDSMSFEVLQENVPEEILGHIESIWIGTLGARAEDHKLGMNMRDGDRFRLSAESRAKILETYKKKDWPKRNPDKEHPIYQYTKLGEFVKEWKNPREISENYNLVLTSIHMCCNRNKTEKKYSLKGYIYSYINHN
jgi:hypothetical protein